MHSERGHDDRSSVSVIPRVRDVLKIKRAKYASPHVGCVVALKELLAAISQRAVSEQEAPAAQSEVFAMILRDAVGNECGANSIELAMPDTSAQAGTEFE